MAQLPHHDIDNSSAVTSERRNASSMSAARRALTGLRFRSGGICWTNRCTKFRQIVCKVPAGVFTTLFAKRTLTHEMGTLKSQTIAVRVPTSIHEAVSEDAADLGMTPGTFLRKLLEARYSARRDARKSTSVARETDEERELVDLR